MPSTINANYNIFLLQLAGDSKYSSCEIVALRENFDDRSKSYNSFSAKSCIFLAREKTRTVCGVYFHYHTHHDPKQGIKKLLRHFPFTLVQSLTLQIPEITQSSLESPTLEFFSYHLPYSRSRCLVKLQSKVKLVMVRQ
jgi:hypothetical protein